MGVFGDAMSTVPGARTRVGMSLRREGVRAGAEFLRVRALRARRLDASRPLVDPVALSAMLRRPGAPTGPDAVTLSADQASAISEIHDCGGGLVGTDVGSGKSLIIQLAAVVTRAQRPLAIMPANTISNFLADAKKMGQHFALSDRLMVASYERLSTVNGKDFLSARMPDWLFLDEAQAFKDPDSARTARWLRYMEAYPDTHVAAFSGSFLDRTIKAFSHVAKWCLRGGSPLPLSPNELDAWALAVDADVDDGERMTIGALEEFLDLLTPEERAALDTTDDYQRSLVAFGARLTHTPGVVWSTSTPTNTAIHVRELAVDVPPAVVDAFENLRSTWTTPQGDEITDAKDLYRVVRQLAQGFFYRWIWPDGKPIIPWIVARQEWHRFVRTTITYSRKHHYDSMKEVKDACERYERWVLARDMGMRDVVEELEAGRSQGRPMLDSQEWRTWLKTEPLYTPVVETVWISDFLVNRVADWLDESPGIAWVESSAMGDAIRRKGFRYYAGGQDEIIHETVSCAAAIKAHATGKNLQAFHRGLVVTPPSKGAQWHQMIGRFDRRGQRSPVVTFDLFLHVRELWSSFYMARRDARFATAPLGSDHKLKRASIDLVTRDTDVPMRIMSGDPLWRMSTAAPVGD